MVAAGRDKRGAGCCSQEDLARWAVVLGLLVPTAATPCCRLCVAAVMDITDITKGKCESDEDKQHFIPVHL